MLDDPRLQDAVVEHNPTHAVLIESVSHKLMTKRNPPKTPRSQAYVRLLNMMQAIRNLSPFSQLTADEERMLGELVVLWHTMPQITVSDVMTRDLSPSASTTYRRLIALRDKGLITLRVDDADKRVKFVEPALLAEEYMERMSKSLGRLIDGERTG